MNTERRQSPTELVLRLSCPYCGVRDETEFGYGGEAGIVRPARPDLLSDDEWADYLFMRTNTRGLLTELWCHTAGCRQWLSVTRDTCSSRVVKMPAPVRPCA